MPSPAQTKAIKTAAACGLAALGVLLVISLLFYVPIWRDDALARRNKAHVNELIKTGQSLSDVEKILRQSGFRLMYETPITPTIRKDYFQQIVIIGNTQINSIESFAYAASLRRMPFTHSESPYMIIDATLEGTIIRIR